MSPESPAAPVAGTNPAEHAAPNYRSLLVAWLALLVITVTMVFVHRPPVLISGMIAKAAIIALWFMHLRFERKDFVFVFILCLFGTAVVLFGLIIPDGQAM